MKIMMSVPRRIVVLGLYNSGSTVLAGMLYRMGVNMGPPFWANSQEGHEHNFYESRQLSEHLRWWWTEPLARERVRAKARISFLLSWVRWQELIRPGPVGAKHPLLSLCGPDLIAAWGTGTCFVRAGRPLEESIHRLQSRRWFPGYEVALQTRLWNALADFERSGHRVVTLNWNCVKTNPARAAMELASAAGLDASEQQLRAAAALVRHQ